MSTSSVFVVIDGTSALPQFKIGDEVAWQLLWSEGICPQYEFAAPGWRQTVTVSEGRGVAGDLTVSIARPEQVPDGSRLELTGPLLLTDRPSAPTTIGEVARIRLVTCVIGDPGTDFDGWTVPGPLAETAVFEELEEAVGELVVEELDHDLWSYRVQFLLVELRVNAVRD